MHFCGEKELIHRALQRLPMATLQVQDHLVNARVYFNGDIALSGRNALETMGFAPCLGAGPADPVAGLLARSRSTCDHNYATLGTPRIREERGTGAARCQTLLLRAVLSHVKAGELHPLLQLHYDIALVSAHASASPYSTFHTCCSHSPFCTAEAPYSRCARLLASFGSLAASPTSVVVPSSLESRRDSDVADPNQNVSRPKAPLPGSSSHAACFGARIMPWLQAGYWLINILIASIAPPP